MNRLVANISILLLMLTLTFIVTATDSPRPKITVSTDFINIGKVKPTDIRKIPLTVQNNGQADLIINFITVDCPCTTFQFFTQDGTQTNLPLTIQPGNKITDKVTFDASKTKYRGQFTKVILIDSNDPAEPIKRVKMIGEIGE